MSRLLGLAGAVGSALWLILYLGGEPRYFPPGSPRFDAYVEFGRYTPALLALVGLGLQAAFSPYRLRLGRIGLAGAAAMAAGAAAMVISRAVKYWILPVAGPAVDMAAWNVATAIDGGAVVVLMAGAGVSGLALLRGGAAQWLALLFLMLPLLTLFGVPSRSDPLPLGVIGFLLGAAAALRAPSPSAGQGALA